MTPVSSSLTLDISVSELRYRRRSNHHCPVSPCHLPSAFPSGLRTPHQGRQSEAGVMTDWAVLFIVSVAPGSPLSARGSGRRQQTSTNSTALEMCRLSLARRWIGGGGGGGRSPAGAAAAVPGRLVPGHGAGASPAPFGSRHRAGETAHRHEYAPPPQQRQRSLWTTDPRSGSAADGAVLQ